MIKITSADFVTSAAELSQCPSGDKPEFAFIGRSNVGKSSLINMLAGKKKLAKTSAVPGKTQLINFFIINKEWHLVDLPGYGYSKVSQEKKKGFEKIISDYVLKRKNMACLFLLIDSRLPLQKADEEFLLMLGENAVPFVLAFTKTDKLPKNKLAASVKNYKQQLLQHWEELPEVFLTSAHTGQGREDMLKFIQKILKHKK